jgi:hypothetical protein
LLGFLVPLAAAQARADGDERLPDADYALRETTPWEGSALPGAGTELTTYRRQKGGEVISDDWQPLMCSAAPAPEPADEPDEPDDDPEDEEPRSAANLLRQSDDAWGGGSGSEPSGVLE